MALPVKKQFPCKAPHGAERDRGMSPGRVPATTKMQRYLRARFSAVLRAAA